MENHSDDQYDASENAIEVFDTDQLPTLEDWMREFSSNEQTNDEAKANIHTISPDSNQLEAELAEARRSISRLKQENQELKTAFARVNGDFDKYRWRIERERAEHYTFAVISIVRQFLPIVDNFGRALASASSTTAPPEALTNFLSGIELIYWQTNKFLSDMGVESIEALGAPFNPQFHEAVAVESNSTVAPNTVIEEILPGYRIGDKLIRPAMVKVSASTNGD